MKEKGQKTVSTYGLTHVAMSVKDVETTLEFYTHIFGMEVMYHERNMIQLTTPGNHDILVFEEKNESLNSIGQSGGIAHIGFRLKQPADIQEIYSRIVQAGAEITSIGGSLSRVHPIFFSETQMGTLSRFGMNSYLNSLRNAVPFPRVRGWLPSISFPTASPLTI